MIANNAFEVINLQFIIKNFQKFCDLFSASYFFYYLLFSQMKPHDHFYAKNILKDKWDRAKMRKE